MGATRRAQKIEPGVWVRLTRLMREYDKEEDGGAPHWLEEPTWVQLGLVGYMTRHPAGDRTEIEGKALSMPVKETPEEIFDLARNWERGG